MVFHTLKTSPLSTHWRGTPTPPWTSSTTFFLYHHGYRFPGSGWIHNGTFSETNLDSRDSWKNTPELSGRASMIEGEVTAIDWLWRGKAPAKQRDDEGTVASVSGNCRT
jgi:hypothetical protein